MRRRKAGTQLCLRRLVRTNVASVLERCEALPSALAPEALMLC